MDRLDRDDVRRASPLVEVIPVLTGDPVVGDGAEGRSRCPFHDDAHPSLRVNHEKQQWYCDVCAVGGDVFKLVERVHACDFAEALRWLARRAGMSSPTISAAPSNRPSGSWVYRDLDGMPAYRATRFDAPNGSKSFCQEKADGNGGFVGGKGLMKGVPRVLYRWADLTGHQTAFFGEGEKVADALRALGWPATTTVGGSGGIKTGPICEGGYAQQLLRVGVKNLVIFPDNDAAGRKYAETIARACHAVGLAVTVVELPDLPPGGDVVDYLNAGHPKDELVAAIQATQLYIPAAAEPANTPGRLALTSLKDLLAEPDEAVSWLVADRMPAGGLVMLAGKPKAGKSTMARDLAFAVACGEPWLGSATEAGTVWYLALEDKRADVRRHFRQMGATGNESISVFTGRSTDELLPQLQVAAAEQRPALIIVDTMQRLIQARDLNDYAEVTRRLQPLLDLARESGATVLLNHHAGKGVRSSLDSVLGSTALTGSVDTVMVLQRTDQHRLLESIQRTGTDLPKTIVTLESESGRVGAGPTKEEADEATVADATLQALASGESLTEAEIARAVEGKTRTKRKVLRGLFGKDQISRTGGGKKGDPFRYGLPDNAQEQAQTEVQSESKNACSLVPTRYAEQEKQESGIPLTERANGGNACSREMAISGSVDARREQETAHRDVDTDPGFEEF